MGMYTSAVTSPGLVTCFPEQYASSQDDAATTIIAPSSTPAPMESSRHSRSSPKNLEEEKRCLQQRIRQLETEPSRGAHAGGLPTLVSTPRPHSTFDEEWRARTEACARIFCSLNRAGNAPCVWHDSRRERQAYPPRISPPGHLNCSCMHEQAPFEETLSRHGVGSYHPVEDVRMDPTHRNPLLQLLQARYGYRERDFERDLRSGNWLEGEGAEK